MRRLEEALSDRLLGAMTGSDPLRVLGLVDLHWSGRRALRLPDLSAVDLVLLGGDLTHFKGVEITRRIVDEMRSANSTGRRTSSVRASGKISDSPRKWPGVTSLKAHLSGEPLEGVWFDRTQEF
jgi:hypothetical protein